MCKEVISHKDKEIIVFAIIHLFATHSNIKTPVYLQKMSYEWVAERNDFEFFDIKHIDDIVCALKEWLLPKNSWEYSIVTGRDLSELQEIIDKVER